MLAVVAPPHTARGSRSPPLDDTDQTAAARIRALLGRLPARGPVPLVVFDAGYDSAQFTLALAEASVAVLSRIRPGSEDPGIGI